MELRLKIVLITGLLIVMVFGGFVQAANVEQQSQFSAPILVVNTSFLNIRMGPGIQYDVLTTVVGGTELPVLGIARDRVWYEVSTLAGVGWVNGEFTIPRGNFTNVPIVQAPALTAVSDVSSDDAVPGFGFVGQRAWGISVVVQHPARTGPTMNSSSPGDALVDLSRIYMLLEAASTDGVTWYRIDVPAFGSIWVEATKTKFRPFACELSAVEFRTSLAPAIGPDGSGNVDGNVRYEAGTEAYLLDHVGSQFKVEMVDGNVGWVASEAASVRGEVYSEYCATGGRDAMEASVPSTNTATRAAARAVINTGFLNIRSGPGAQYTVVATVPGGTELAITGFAPDGVWYQVRGDFGQGWLNSEFILFRGDGSRVPTVRGATGIMARPQAQITNAVVLYAAPNTTLGQIGALSGPIDVDIVARNPDFTWVQLRTDLGFGWVPVDQVTLQGDTSLVPVVSR